MPLSNIFAAFAPHQHPTAARAFQLAGARSLGQRTLARQSAMPDLSVSGHLLLPATIFLVSLLTIEFSHRSNFIATVWPVDAIMLVASLRHARKLSNDASIIVGGSAATALASFLSGNGITLSATLLVANFVEVAIALALLTMTRIGAANLPTFRNLLIFIVVAGGIAPIGSTVLSAVAFAAVHGVSWLVILGNWYPGHALGMIIVAPFLICVTSNEWHAQRIKDRLVEVATVVTLFIAIGICASYFRSVIFVMAPAILFVTIRFGLVGATAATFLTALIASTFVVMGIGQPILAQPEMSERILGLQAFLAITSLWSLPTAALLAERDRLLHDLSDANSHLMAESEQKSHLVVGLRRHLSAAEENERLRLSRDLHDQAGQSLIAAILEINEIDSMINGPGRDRLHLVRKRMEELGKNLHRIAWELRPPSIDELGLRKALASYIADWGERCGTDADFHCDDPRLDEVPNEIGTAIYRIVQEGLTNIVKHAQRPSNVSVVIRRSDTTLQVIVEDNGCGFDVAAIVAMSGKHRGLGLDGMRERLSLVGGTLEIESGIGAGTTIFARITLDDPRLAG
jgi:signal transduction histidine kinase